MGGLRLCQVVDPGGPSVRLKRSPAWNFRYCGPYFTILRGIHNHSPLEGHFRLMQEGMSKKPSVWCEG